MHKITIIAVLIALIAVNTDAGQPRVIPLETKPRAGNYKFVCYLGSWANYRPDNGKFVIEDIDPSACTHIVYGFAKLESDKITPYDTWLDLEDNWGLAGYKRFNELRAKNPNLKTLIAIGGWNEGSEKYSQMARDASRRATFVKSVVDFLDKYGFDGFDFDWEYPANRGGIPEDKDNFVQTLKELKDAFGSKYLLTAAVSAGKATIDTAYDIPKVNQYLDLINLMAYDFHGAWDPFTAPNAPLYGKSDEPEAQKNFNVDFSVDYWLSNGASKDKLVLGIPLYGRTFTLQSADTNGMYAATTGPGTAGQWTREAGFVGYHEICLQRPSGWTLKFDDGFKIPYMYKDRQWIGYDDPNSIKLKVDYLKEKGLAGAMIWSLDTDDFRGTCGEGRNPLITAIVNGLGGSIRESPGTPNKPEVGFKCKAPGLFRDSEDCSKFIQCIVSGTTLVKHERQCPTGTLFDDSNKTCNHATVVNCGDKMKRKMKNNVI